MLDLFILLLPLLAGLGLVWWGVRLLRGEVKWKGGFVLGAGLACIGLFAEIVRRLLSIQC
ncbi:MAG: hypothetical protein ACRYFZ_26895 [Janthinobacterium lividum]